MSPVKVAPNPILLKENDSINQLIFDTVTWSRKSEFSTICHLHIPPLQKTFKPGHF